MSYLPENTIQFADGRVGVLPTFFILSPEVPEVPDSFYLTLIVLSNESGQWLLDDWLPICIGDCDDYIDGAPWDGNNSQWTEGGESATPAATPEATIDWTAWVTPQECTVEPMSQDEYAGIMRAEMSVPDREYTVVGKPDQDNAIAAATVLREHEACANDRQTMEKRALESPWYVHVTNSGFVVDETPQERRANAVDHGEELSAGYPDQDPEHFVFVSDETNLPSSSFVGFIYRPDDAVLLSDGRIAIPATKLFANEPPNPDTISFAMILTDESGEWRVDESLSFCVGECDAYWSAVRGDPGIPAASPVASPVATPETTVIPSEVEGSLSFRDAFVGPDRRSFDTAPRP